MCYCGSRLPSCEPMENALEYDSVNDCYKVYRNGEWIKYIREIGCEIVEAFNIAAKCDEEGFDKLK
jgi:hypothetical protein